MTDTTEATADPKTTQLADGSLNSLLLPNTIAVVGASEREGSAGRLALSALNRQFCGTVYAVNPRQDSVLGYPAYADVQSLPERPDLVVLAVPGPATLPIVRDCVKLGVGGVLVFGSGFAEAGAEGAALQKELADVVAGTGTRLLGPNSLGFCDTGRGTLATFLFAESSPLPQDGPLALVSQSGAIAEQLIARSEEAGVGMRWVLSTGNELNVTLSDGFEFLLEQDSAKIIVLFAESIKDPTRFMAAAARARELGKPVVVIKTGRSAAGARAAVTHTASLAGPDRVFDRACIDLGVIRVSTVDEIIDVVRILASGQKAPGTRLAIVSASGGGGVLAADLAEDVGLEVPELPETVRSRIRQLIPSFGSAVNPVDVTSQGAEDPEVFRNILEAVVESDDVDLLACVFSTHGPVAVTVAKTIVDVASRTSKPVVAVWGSPEKAASDVFDQARFPYFSNPRNALESLSAISRGTTAPQSTGTTPRFESGHKAECCDICTGALSGVVLEHQAREILDRYGVRSASSRTARSGGEAAAAADDLGFPLVMKLMAASVPHREKAGGISLNVASSTHARTEFDRLGAIADASDTDWAVNLAQQIPRGTEVMVGAQRDPEWGATILVGIGGTQTELIDRTTLRLSPVSVEQALAAVEEIFGTHLSSEAARQVAHTMVGVSHAMEDHPQIESIDINPLIAAPQGLIAVDALINLIETP